MKPCLKLLPAMLPLLLAACTQANEAAPPVTTPRSIVEMQLRSRATMPPGPGVPGVEAERLDGSRLHKDTPPSSGGGTGWGDASSLGVSAPGGLR